MKGERSRVLKVRSRKQWKAIASPIRVEILTSMEGLESCTVAELAERLERKVPSLYPHLATLEAAGFVEVVSGGPGTNAPVAYRNAYDVVDFDMESLGETENAQLDTLIGRTLRAAERRYNDHELRALAARANLFRMNVSDSRFTREQVVAIARHLAAIDRIVRESKKAPIGRGDADGTVRLSLLTGAMPVGDRARQDLASFEALDPSEIVDD